jgi:putative NIF3 family GTP cyclohydrolase 1 type 2
MNPGAITRYLVAVDCNAAGHTRAAAAIANATISQHNVIFLSVTAGSEEGERYKDGQLQRANDS